MRRIPNPLQFARFCCWCEDCSWAAEFEGSYDSSVTIRSKSHSRSLVTDLTWFSAPKWEMHTRSMPPMGRSVGVSDLEATQLTWEQFSLCTFIHSAFTWAQEQIVFGRSVLRLQGQSLSTVFFLLFQDTQKVTDRWDSSDLQILKAVESFFLLKLTCPRQDLPFLCSHSPCNPINWLWAIFPWNTVNFLEIHSIFLIKSAFL